MSVDAPQDLVIGSGDADALDTNARGASTDERAGMTPEYWHRLSDLLVDVREALDFEVKNWLNLRDSNDQATFAKAVLALANHGGGFVVLGFEDKGTGFVEADGRPVTLDRYSQDLVNGIVRNYCDPAFHCAVDFVPSTVGAVFPIVRVSGEHRVPIRARRDGPNGKTVQNHAIYIRKPGPCSEIPQSAQDWDELFARCLRNRRDEMLDQIRDLITGAVPQVKQPPPPARLVVRLRRMRPAIGALTY